MAKLSHATFNRRRGKHSHAENGRAYPLPHMLCRYLNEEDKAAYFAGLFHDVLSRKHRISFTKILNTSAPSQDQQMQAQAEIGNSQVTLGRDHDFAFIGSWIGKG